MARGGFAGLSAFVLGVGSAFACAVPTRVQVDKRAAVALRVEQRRDLLAPGGLAPDASASITLPTCMGSYAVVAAFADGRITALPALNAATIRTLTIR